MSCANLAFGHVRRTEMNRGVAHLGRCRCVVWVTLMSKVIKMQATGTQLHFVSKGHMTNKQKQPMSESNAVGVRGGPQCGCLEAAGQVEEVLSPCCNCVCGWGGGSTTTATTLHKAAHLQPSSLKTHTFQCDDL